MTDRHLTLRLALDRAAATAETLSIPVSIASAAIIDDPYLGPVQLSMDPAAVDLTDAQARGIPVLEMHERELPIGRVFDVRIDGDRLVGTMRFSRSDEGKQLYQDCVDGIITDTSVGAAISAVREEQGYLVALRWRPNEVSLVDRGADPSVGINRSAANRAASLPTHGALHMSEPNPTPAAEPQGAAPANVITMTPSTQEMQRVTNITELARWAKEKRQINVDGMAEEHVQFNEPYETFRTKVYDLVQKQNAQQPPIVAQDPATQLGLSRKEAQQFSIVRAAQAYLTKDWKKASFELECSRSIAEQLNREAKGFFVPWEVQREMAAGNPSAGGYLVGTDHRDDLFIESLRARSIAFQAGVRTLTGLKGNRSIPKLTGNSTFGWIQEGVDAALSDPALGSVELSPRTIAGGVAMTRRLLMQSAPSVEMMVRDDLMTGCALAIDLAVFEGTGAAGTPRGLVNHPDINTVSVSTDGSPTFAEIVQFESEIAADNALSGSLKYVTTPAVRGKLKTTSRDGGGHGFMFILEGEQANGYPVLTSTQLTQHTLLFGDWSQIVVGFWGVMEIKPDEATRAASAGLILRVFQDCDIAIRHGQAFAKAT
ncbi:MAG: phage major capsid protein [Methylobacterium sp.]|nr:phage major capsid protein [Methylobacterium sp.]